jgi:hypothetical protein
LAAAGPRQGSRSLGGNNDVDGGELIGDTKGVLGVEQVDVDDGEFIGDVKAVVVGERIDVDDGEFIGDTNGVDGVEQVDVNEAEVVGDVKAVVVGEQVDVDDGEFIDGAKGVVVCEPVNIDDDKAVVGASGHADVVKSAKALAPVGDDLSSDFDDCVDVTCEVLDNIECGDDGCEDEDIVKDSNALEHVGDADVDETLSSDNFKRLNEGDSISISSFSSSSVDTAGCIIDSLLTFLLVLLKYFVNTLFSFDI